MPNFHLDLSSQSMEAYVSLFGMNDQNVALIEQECKVNISARDGGLVIAGEAEGAALAEQAIRALLEMIARHEPVDRMRIRYVLAMVQEGKTDFTDTELDSVVAVTHRGKQIRAKTLGQRQYVDTIRSHELTFAIGPAGTGKTYLAMALAVVALKNKEVERIILTRPAVEAGEKLGFLPGDLQQKVDPYLRPLYDAINEMMGAEAFQRLMDERLPGWRELRRRLNKRGKM